MAVGDRESYTIVNHVIEFSVRGGRWTTWGGVHPDIVAGLDDDAVMKVFISNLRTRHDPATGMRFRLVHRTAVIEDIVVAEEMEDGRVAVPKEPSCGATPAGRNWPSCALAKDHREDDPEDPHQSADFYWLDGEPEAHFKSDTGA